MRVIGARCAIVKQGARRNRGLERRAGAPRPLLRSAPLFCPCEAVRVQQKSKIFSHALRHDALGGNLASRARPKSLIRSEQRK